MKNEISVLESVLEKMLTAVSRGKDFTFENDNLVAEVAQYEDGMKIVICIGKGCVNDRGDNEKDETDALERAKAEYATNRKQFSDYVKKLPDDVFKAALDMLANDAPKLNMLIFDNPYNIKDQKWAINQFHNAANKAIMDYTVKMKSMMVGIPEE